MAHEGQQNLSLCSKLTSFELRWILFVPYLLWHLASIFKVSFDGPLRNVASYGKPGAQSTYPNLDLHGIPYIQEKQSRVEHKQFTINESNKFEEFEYFFRQYIYLVFHEESIASLPIVWNRKKFYSMCLIDHAYKFRSYYRLFFVYW